MLLMGKKKPGRKPDPTSKRAQNQDRHTQPRKAFHAPGDLFGALEKFIEDTNPKPTESAVLRSALEEFLEKRGYWPIKEQ